MALFWKVKITHYELANILHTLISQYADEFTRKEFFDPQSILKGLNRKEFLQEWYALNFWIAHSSKILCNKIFLMRYLHQIYFYKNGIDEATIEKTTSFFVSRYKDYDISFSEMNSGTDLMLFSAMVANNVLGKENANDVLVVCKIAAEITFLMKMIGAAPKSYKIIN